MISLILNLLFAWGCTGIFVAVSPLTGFWNGVCCTVIFFIVYIDLEYGTAWEQNT